MEARAQDPQNRMMAGVARMMTELRRAREDPMVFFQHVMRTPQGEPYAAAPFHHEWSRALDQYPKVLILGPRGHSKTGLLQSRVLWEVGHDPNLRVKIVSNSDKTAFKFLGEVRALIERAPMLNLVFPNLKPGGADWAASRASIVRQTTAKDSTFEALGVLSTAVGGRGDLLIFDDVVDYRNACMYPRLQEELKTKFLSEHLPVLEPGGRVWIIGTPWSQSDLYAFLKENPDWHVVTTPVGTDDDIFAPIWPAVFPREELVKRYLTLGPFEYDRAYRCQALRDDAAPIRPEWIRYYDADLLGSLDRVQQYICTVGIDLAISEKAGADYFAWVVALYDPSRNRVFIVEAGHARLSFLDQAQRIIDRAAYWRPQRVGIETGGYQGALAQYLNDRAPLLPIVPIPAKGKKIKRLLDVTPHFQNARVHFNPTLDPVKNPRVLESGNIVGELLGFGRERHDDLADALVYAIQCLSDYLVRDEVEDVGFIQGDGLSMRLSVVGDP